jgi:hypothetical protein
MGILAKFEVQHFKFCRFSNGWRGTKTRRSTLIGENLQRTLLAAAAWEGRPLNYFSIGKQLDISCTAAKARVHHLVEARAVWLLHPLEAGPAGRSRKSPKLYLNPSARSLLPSSATPVQRDILFRSRMIRTVRNLEATRRPSSSFFYYGGYGKTHVELIVQAALKRIGFVFLSENHFNRRCWSYCKRVFKLGIIQGAFVLYPGHRIFFAADRLVVLPTVEFCKHYRRWMNACLGSSRNLLLRMVRAYNTTHARHLS